MWKRDKKVQTAKGRRGRRRDWLVLRQVSCSPTVNFYGGSKGKQERSGGKRAQNQQKTTSIRKTGRKKVQRKEAEETRHTGETERQKSLEER